MHKLYLLLAPVLLLVSACSTNVRTQTTYESDAATVMQVATLTAVTGSIFFICLAVVIVGIIISITKTDLADKREDEAKHLADKARSEENIMQWTREREQKGT